MIIDSGANLDKAVADIMKAKTFNVGQLCLACDYVLLPAALQESFIAKAKDYVQTAYYQNGSFNNGDYAQIINLANFNRLKHLFDDAVAKGAKSQWAGYATWKTAGYSQLSVLNIRTRYGHYG